MPQFSNSDAQYGLVSRVFHWGMALVIFAMYGLGLWMDTLDYYSQWYQTAPNIHKSIGMILLALLLLRLIWRLAGHTPSDDHLKPWERRLALVMHWVFYALLVALMIAGYLIATVDGRSLDVFGLVSIPPIIVHKGLEELAGDVHEILADGLIILAAVHAAAALKHHFIDRDITLARMLPALKPSKSPR